MNFEVFDIKHYDLTPGDVHIDAALSEVILNYSPKGFIADQIMPIVNVAKQSDQLYKLDQGDQFRSEPDRRVPGRSPNYISFDVTSEGYYAKNYALGTYLTSEEISNADTALDMQILRSQFVSNILLINYELRVANIVNSTSNVGSSTTTASAWGTANADPYLDLQSDIATFEDLTGYAPNGMVFGKAAWRKFRDSEAIQTLIFPHGGGIPNKNHVRDLFEIDKVLVGGAYYNNAAEGASMALTKIWNDNVLLFYAPPAPSKQEPSFGYSFRWTVQGMPNMQVRVFPFDEKLGRQDMHIGYYQDEKIVDSNLSFLRTGCGSSQ